MTIAVLSVNHNLAPVEIREKVAFQADELIKHLNQLQQTRFIKSCVILSTCNRSEIYVNADTKDLDQLQQILSDWLAKSHNINYDELKAYLSFFTNNDAVEYTISVAVGLNSLVLGEPQILGQLKDAYASAKEAKCLDNILEKLFQHTFKVAKKIRTQTAIGSSPVSVAYCSIKLAERIFTDLSEQTVLLIGAGEMIELCAKHLMEKNIKKIIIANRTIEKAQIIADNYDNSHTIVLSELHHTIHKADIVISSTASQLPVLGKGLIEHALLKRKHKPMFILDIAVPRDVEPEVSQLNDAYLYTIDDLSEIIEKNTQDREVAKDSAKKIIEKDSKEFQKYLNTLPNNELIKDYRQQANEIKQQTLAIALKKITNKTDTAEVLSFLADQLTNKLIHNPSQVLKNTTDNDICELAKKLLIK